MTIKPLLVSRSTLKVGGACSTSASGLVSFDLLTCADRPATATAATAAAHAIDAILICLLQSSVVSRQSLVVSRFAITKSPDHQITQCRDFPPPRLPIRRRRARS